MTARARLGFVVLALGTVPVTGRAQLPDPPPIAALVADWTPVDAEPGRFSIVDGALRVEGGGGWLRSDRRYADFELTAVIRFASAAGDSGIFVRAEPNRPFGRGWPANSYQIQLRNPLGDSPFPPIGALFRHGTADGPERFDEAAARDAFTGTGQWQTVVIRATADKLEVELNGRLVNEAAGITNATGYIGIQSETGVLELRSLLIDER